MHGYLTEFLVFSNLVLIENKLRLDDICAVFLFFFFFYINYCVKLHGTT